jgi:hypothetical protein
MNIWLSSIFRIYLLLKSQYWKEKMFAFKKDNGQLFHKAVSEEELSLWATSWGIINRYFKFRGDGKSCEWNIITILFQTEKYIFIEQ